MLTRCPLVPFKENPREYSEYFQLYSFKEKSILAEPGAFYDQPAVYLDIMSEMDSAVSDSMNPEKRQPPVPAEETEKTESLSTRLGVPITKK